MHVLSMILPYPAPCTDLMGILGVILSLLIPLIITLIIARFRSFFAAFWFIACFVQLAVYLISNVESISLLMTSGNTLLNGMLIGLNALSTPVGLFHECIVRLLLLISSTNSIYLSVVESDIFAFVLYLILFFLSFVFFHKKKRKRKPKLDDDF